MPETVLETAGMGLEPEPEPETAGMGLEPVPEWVPRLGTELETMLGPEVEAEAE